MTPKRKAALQWFFDRGEVRWFVYAESPPSRPMLNRMLADGQLSCKIEGDFKPLVYALTDKGRRDLHEAGQ